VPAAGGWQAAAAGRAGASASRTRYGRPNPPARLRKRRFCPTLHSASAVACGVSPARTAGRWPAGHTYPSTRRPSAKHATDDGDQQALWHDCAHPCTPYPTAGSARVSSSQHSRRQPIRSDSATATRPAASARRPAPSSLDRARELEDEAGHAGRAHATSPPDPRAEACELTAGGPCATPSGGRTYQLVKRPRNLALNNGA